VLAYDSPAHLFLEMAMVVNKIKKSHFHLWETGYKLLTSSLGDAKTGARVRGPSADSTVCFHDRGGSSPPRADQSPRTSSRYCTCPSCSRPSGAACVPQGSSNPAARTTRITVMLPPQ
jgi:hypothetical protein